MVIFDSFSPVYRCLGWSEIGREGCLVDGNKSMGLAVVEAVVEAVVVAESVVAQAVEKVRTNRSQGTSVLITTRSALLGTRLHIHTGRERRYLSVLQLRNLHQNPQMMSRLQRNATQVIHR